MKQRELLTNTGGKNAPKISDESGFGILSAIVFLALIAFIVLAVIKTLSILIAVLGFIGVVILVVVLASLPDIRRYAKISNM